MKTFISHSSKDKWAAKRISSELNFLGITTFLDEKDIKTGESIDVKVQEHLSDCNDLLILISPASLNSHWVLIELGGAIALKKNIIPIFLYVGANEIPHPINKILGRDINEIERYYEEVKQKSRGKTISRVEPEKNIVLDEKFKIGNIVKLPSTPQNEDVDPGWVENMDSYMGLTAKIIDLIVTENVQCALVDIDNGEWSWALSWLVKLS